MLNNKYQDCLTPRNEKKGKKKKKKRKKSNCRMSGEIVLHQKDFDVGRGRKEWN